MLVVAIILLIVNCIVAVHVTDKDYTLRGWVVFLIDLALFVLLLFATSPPSTWPPLPWFNHG